MGRPKKNLAENVLEAVESVDDSSLLPLKSATKVPQMYDPEWSDYVLSHLTTSEKDEVNQFPKLAGLRRLTLKLIGDIVESRCELVDTPADDNRFNASALYHLRIIDLEGNIRLYTGAGGSNEGNTDKPYGRYPESMASNRAEARALRSALALNVVAAEEVSEVADESDPSDAVAKMTSAQKIGIERQCEILKLNINKLVNMGKNKYTGLDDNNITKEVAKGMIQLLNKYNQDENSIPAELRNV